MGQYAAILLGFVGVIVIIRPATDGFSAWSLAAAGTAGCMVVREFATRRTGVATPAVAIAFLTAVGMWFTILGSALIVVAGLAALHFERHTRQRVGS